MRVKLLKIFSIIFEVRNKQMNFFTKISEKALEL